MVCGMKTTIKVQIGSGTEPTGYTITHRWIMAIIFAEFALVGFQQRKSRLTTSSLVQPVTCFSIVIFNQPMVTATIVREADGYPQLSANRFMST